MHQHRDWLALADDRCHATSWIRGSSTREPQRRRNTQTRATSTRPPPSGLARPSRLLAATRTGQGWRPPGSGTPSPKSVQPGLKQPGQEDDRRRAQSKERRDPHRLADTPPEQACHQQDRGGQQRQRERSTSQAIAGRTEPDRSRRTTSIATPASRQELSAASWICSSRPAASGSSVTDSVLRGASRPASAPAQRGRRRRTPYPR